MKKPLVPIALAAILASTVGFLIAAQGSESPGASAITSPSATPTAVGRVTGSRKDRSSAHVTNGYIEGAIVYPGEGIPRDIRVCAINLATAKETCTRRFETNPRFKSGKGYRLGVAPGNYQVYAVAPSFDPGYQAFYSAFVVCGYRADCTDHSPITISVESGKTRTDIEPGDFYD